LQRGELIGRLDAKAHRSDGVFEVKSLYLQPGLQLDDEALLELAQAMARCAAWHGTPQVVLTDCAPATLRGRLRKALTLLATQAGMS
jgi:uncharacterized protein YcaQ